MRKLNYGSSNDNFQPNYQQNRPKEKYSHIDQRDDLESTHTLYPAVWYGRIRLVFGCFILQSCQISRDIQIHVEMMSSRIFGAT